MSTGVRVKLACMNARRHDPQLPIPNPDDWLTRNAAAEILGVDPATVTRMVTAGRLTAYCPRGGNGEQRPTLYWLPEVRTLAEARRIAREGVSAR